MASFSPDVDARPARATPLGLAAVVVAVSGFSLLNLVVKLTHASAVTFAFYRLWLGALAMVVASLVTRRPPTWATLKQTVVPGALFGINILFFVLALKHTGVADVLIIGALQPALTLLVAGPLFGERVTRSDVVWTLISVAGIGLVTIGSSGSPVWSLAGDLFAVCALIAFTIYFLMSKRVRTRLSAVEYMTGVTIFAALVVTPVALIGRADLALRPTDLAWLLLFVAGAQGGHVMLAWAHEHVDVSISSLLILGEPVIASVAAWLVLGEPLTVLEAVGGVVAIGGMAVVVRAATRRTGQPITAPEGSEAPPIGRREPRSGHPSRPMGRSASPAAFPEGDGALGEAHVRSDQGPGQEGP